MLSTESLCKKDQIQVRNEPQHLKTNNQNPNQKNQQQNPQKQSKKIINFFKLYKYADKVDFALIFIGVLLSVATGCGLPFFALVAGNMVDAFQLINDEMLSKTATARNQFLYIGFGTFTAAFLTVVTWMKVGERVSLKCRRLYLQSLLKKNPKEVDKFTDKKVLQEMENDFILFRQALGFKVGSFIFIAASLVAGGRNAISTGWLLSLIMVSTLPLLGISGVLYTFFVQLKKSKMQKCYDEAQKRSQNVLLKLKQVKTLNGEKHQLFVYDKLCTFLSKKIMLFSSLVGLSAGWFSLVQFGVYALAFWFGSHCVQGSKPCQIHDQNDRYSPGGVIVIFFAFYVRLDSMQQILPTLRKIYGGMQAGFRIYEVIQNEQCQIDENLQQKQKQQFQRVQGQGCIEFENVSLYVQKDEDRKILDEVSIVLDKRLVSISGGRRQVISMRDLILGLIRPDKGKIKMDGVDLQKIATNQLMGYIGEQMGQWMDNQIMNKFIQGFSNIKCKQDQKMKQIEKLMREFGMQQHLIGHINEIQKCHQQRILTYEERRKVFIMKVLLKKPRILMIDRIYIKGMEPQQYQIFNQVLKSTSSCIIYLGINRQILSSIHNRYYILNGQVNLTKNIESLSSSLPFKYPQTLKNPAIFKTNTCTIEKTPKQQMKKPPQIEELQQQQKILQLYSNQFLLNLIPFIKQFKATFSLGLFFSFLTGLLYPIFTIFLADILLQTFKFKNQVQQTSFIRQHIQRPVLVIVYIGISSFVFNFMENIIFSFLNQKIKHQVRIKSYQKLLHLPLDWYSSSPLHEPYIVTKRLKQNGTQIASILTGYLPIIIKNLVSTISGLIIAFIFQWRTALLGFITLPMMMASGYLLMRFFNQNDPKTQNKYKQSSTVLFQATNNFRTVKINGMTDLVKQFYGQKLSQCQHSSFLRSLLVGLKFGLSQLFIFVSFAILFYFGSVFLEDNSEKMTVLSLFTGIFAVIWPGWTGGSNFFRTPDYDKCKRAECYFMDVMDSQQQKVIQHVKDLKLKFREKIQFVGIKTEKNGQDLMLNKLVLQMGAEQKLSYIVDHSKVMSVLTEMVLGLHQYEGQIFIDDADVKQFGIKTLRKKIIQIEDDPFIFQGSLKQNILYNLSPEIDSEIQQLWELFNGHEHQDQDQQHSQKVKSYISQFDQLPSQKLVQNKESYNLETIISDANKIPKDVKMKISLMIAVLRRPQILFIFSKNKFEKEFFQKVLQSDYGKGIKKIFIIEQQNQDLSHSKNQILFIKQKHVHSRKN